MPKWIGNRYGDVLGAGSTKTGIFSLFDQFYWQYQDLWPTGGAPGIYLSYGYGDSGTSQSYRIDYASDLTTEPARSARTYTNNTVSAHTNPTYAYYAGGYVTTKSSRLTLSSDLSAQSTRGNLSVPVNSGGGAHFSPTHGYVGSGGNGNGSTTWTSYIQRINFASDLTTFPSVTTTFPNGYATGTGYSDTVYGWTVAGATGGFGGIGSTNRSYTLRMTYSSDTSALSSRASYPQSVRGTGGGSNSEFGYSLGGIGGSGNVSYNYRLDLASDLTSQVSRANSIVSAYNIGATVNSTDIWWAGGLSPAGLSYTQRLTFSNDLTMLTRGNLFTPGRSVGANHGTM